MRKTTMVILAGTILCGSISGCGGGGGTRFDGTSTGGKSSVGDGAAGNDAPTIGGNPPQAILYGETYSFAPFASDSDGEPLRFSIENRPSWADFNPANGRLYGQPTIGDIGTYADIVITVSDGKTSQSLPAFSIEVSQAALGSVTLSWNPPTENEDGTALTDLAGYEIHYGRESGNYYQTIRIDNPSITTYVIEQLAPGTYYFAATAFNDAGVESQFSGEAIRTLY